MPLEDDPEIGQKHVMGKNSNTINSIQLYSQYYMNYMHKTQQDDKMKDFSHVQSTH
jgi:hypothetical protein